MLHTDPSHHIAGAIAGQLGADHKLS